jgi:hypothetical protein
MNWIQNGSTVEVDYPDNTEVLINQILAIHEEAEKLTKAKEKQYTVKKFRNLILKKIVAQI